MSIGNAPVLGALTYQAGLLRPATGEQHLLDRTPRRHAARLSVGKRVRAHPDFDESAGRDCLEHVKDGLEFRGPVRVGKLDTRLLRSGRFKQQSPLLQRQYPFQENQLASCEIRDNGT